MKVSSVRLGLVFGEKKVLIRPIKVYWAPSFEVERENIHSILKFLNAKSSKYFSSY